MFSFPSCTLPHTLSSFVFFEQLLHGYDERSQGYSAFGGFTSTSRLCEENLTFWIFFFLVLGWFFRTNQAQNLKSKACIASSISSSSSSSSSFLFFFFLFHLYFFPFPYTRLHYRCVISYSVFSWRAIVILSAMYSLTDDVMPSFSPACPLVARFLSSQKANIKRKRERKRDRVSKPGCKQSKNKK